VQRYLVGGARVEHLELTVKRFGRALIGDELIDFITKKVNAACALCDEVMNKLLQLHAFISTKFHPIVAHFVVGILGAITAVIGFVAAALAATITLVACVVKAAVSAVIRVWNMLFGP